MNISSRKFFAPIALVSLCFAASNAVADDMDDVRGFIERYAALEGNLEEQAEMIRDDRVMIATGVRQRNNAQNMAAQMAQRDHASRVNGGPAKWMMRAEDAEIRIYGDVAVASFMRLTSIFPANASAINTSPLWVTLVMVKERGNWGIAHTHVSGVGPNSN